MPQRFLRPGIRNSDRWNRCDERAQGLFVRLLTIVDDYGRYDGRPAVLLGDCYSVWNANNPKCQHDVSTVTALCEQLANNGLVHFYNTPDGKCFLQIAQWIERPRVKSKWPEPVSTMLAPCCHSAGTVLSPCPPSSPSPSPSPSPLVVDKIIPLIESETTTHPKTQKFTKPTIDELKLAMAKAGCPESEADTFYNHFESNGWKVGGKAPMRSWQSAVATWAIRYRSNFKTQQITNADKIVLQSELQRVIQKMQSIQQTYAGHQTWRESDAKHFNELKKRKLEIQEKLGIKF